jgi:hypothetical protein
LAIRTIATTVMDEVLLHNRGVAQAVSRAEAMARQAAS